MLGGSAIPTWHWELEGLLLSSAPVSTINATLNIVLKLFQMIGDGGVSDPLIRSELYIQISCAITQLTIAPFKMTPASSSTLHSLGAAHS